MHTPTFQLLSASLDYLSFKYFGCKGTLNSNATQFFLSINLLFHFHAEARFESYEGQQCITCRTHIWGMEANGLLCRHTNRNNFTDVVVLDSTWEIGHRALSGGMLPGSSEEKKIANHVPPACHCRIIAVPGYQYSGNPSRCKGRHI
jgi:hypothetical protein